jgi:agmatine/peptidylarginine deiminase
MTEEERQSLSTYTFSTEQPRGITTPPEGNLRNMAEWEETDYLLITWVPQYRNTLTGIVAAAVKECKVLIISNNPSSVESHLTGANVALDSVEIIDRGYNTIWIRDYAANNVYKNWNDSLILVDWIYNRPRPLDNSAPSAHAEHLDIPLYQMTTAPTDVIGTGGNYMSDGFGTAFSSNLILDENKAGNSFNVTPKTEEELDEIMQNFMGIDTYIKMTNLPYDDIHHIDMHMKLIDEETLLVSEYPEGVADGPQIEANLAYVLENFNSVYGTPFRVIRIPSPPSTGGLYPDQNGYYRTYANQVFVNNTVIVPYYREEFDTIAERILTEAMPGYKIVGVNVDGANGEQLIAMGGAIHCITHSIGTQAPMIISHQRLRNTYDTLNAYEVNAYMSHRSEIKAATLYYRTEDGGAYTAINMTQTDAENWSALIPAQASGTKIQYYVEGEANSGKIQQRPMPAPEGYWEFKVLGGETVGLTEYNIDKKAVYPNPANAMTVIPVVGISGEQGTISLIDAIGRTVEVIHEGSFELGEKNYFFDAGNYAKGTYSVKIRTNKRIENHNLVIF